MSAALIIVAAAFAAALALGLRARAGRTMGLEQWTVGGRGFGTAFVFLLMAGEIYTTFTFLGGSGIAYGKGGPAYYILCYLTLAYVTSYWLLPPVWRYAKERRLFTQPDFFAAKYESPALGMLVALVGLVALVPYMVLQFKGLGIIVSTASYGAISPAVAVWIGAVAVTVYVVVSGVHGSAWTAVLKDISILGVVVFLGIYLPLRYYGGYQAMFEAIEAQKPGFLALPAQGQSPTWFATTTLLTALGAYMWPHTFGSLYTAKEPRSFRRNAAILPLYQLINLFVFVVGFAAVLQVPGLTGPNVDLALFKISLQTFPPWFIGVIGATGVLTALVPGSMILIAASTLLANNIVRPLAAASHGLQLCHAALPMLHYQPHGAQSPRPAGGGGRDPCGRRHGGVDQPRRVQPRPLSATRTASRCEYRRAGTGRESGCYSRRRAGNPAIASRAGGGVSTAPSRRVRYKQGWGVHSPRWAVSHDAPRTATLTSATRSVEAALISGFTPRRT